MRPRIVVTVDVERDYPNGLRGSYLGITEGLPRLLDVLAEFDIKGDFFVSQDIVQSYGDTIRGLEAKGHILGNHGSQHEYLCKMDLEAQLQDISESTEALSLVSSSRPVVFRAPQFGANGNTILALEELGYQMDSSVLPGRLVRKPLLGKVLDFTNAPRGVYRPSRSDITTEGESSIVEVPLAENPLRRGTPIGMGYLNSAGDKAAMDACKAHRGSYVTFLIHPWECVDIAESFPHLPKHLAKECSSDMSSLERLLGGLSAIGEFVNLFQIADECEGVDSK